MTSRHRICVGKIATAHGVKGLVKIACYAQDPELLESDALYTSQGSDETLKIKLKNKGGKYWIGRVNDISDRNDAEALRGTSLWIDRNTLPEPDEDEFYIEDLIGLPVQDTNGNHIGELLALQNFGAGDLLEIKPEDGKPSFYHPFTRAAVPEISESRITIAILNDS